MKALFIFFIYWKDLFTIINFQVSFQLICSNFHEMKVGDENLIGKNNFKMRNKTKVMKLHTGTKPIGLHIGK